MAPLASAAVLCPPPPVDHGAHSDSLAHSLALPAVALAPSQGEEVGPTIDVLKIDVEGAELDVLKGISAEDWAKVQVAVIEVHDKNGNLAPVRAILRANGLTDIFEEQDLITKPLMIWQILARRKQPSAGGVGL